LYWVYGKLAIWTLALLAADQVMKVVARHSIHYDGIEVLPFLKLERVENTGIAFGMLGGHSTLILAVSVAIVSLLLAATWSVGHNRRLVIPMALLLAGSIGNLIDRLAVGSVTDFFHVPHWPAFNLADIFIVSGVCLLAFVYLFPEGIKGGEVGKEEAVRK
jgi:signal peptidase II